MKKFLSGLLTAPIDHLRYQDGALVQTALRSVKLLGVRHRCISVAAGAAAHRLQLELGQPAGLKTEKWLRVPLSAIFFWLFPRFLHT